MLLVAPSRSISAHWRCARYAVGSFLPVGLPSSPSRLRGRISHFPRLLQDRFGNAFCLFLPSGPGGRGSGRQPGLFENCRREPHACLRSQAGLEVSGFASRRSSRRRRARDAVAARARVITLPLWPTERTGLGSPVVAGSQFGEHAVVLQRCGVAHGLPPGGDVAEQTPHDLTAAGLG